MKNTLLIITSLILIVGCGSGDKTPSQKSTSSKKTTDRKTLNEDKVLYDMWYDLLKEFPSQEELVSEKVFFYGNTLVLVEGIMGVPFDEDPYIKPFNGMATFHHPNGQKSSEGNYKKGKKDGKWVEWYKNGNKKEVGYYKDGERDVASFGWDKNNEKEVDIYEDGKWKVSLKGVDETVKKYTDRWGWPLGRGRSVGVMKLLPVEYSRWEKFGKWKHWSLNGEDSIEVIYKDNNIWEGNWVDWYKMGEKQREETYKDGKRDGKWTEWREDTWKVVKKHGKWTKEREDGGKKSEGNYKDGESDGLETWWYKNGQKSWEKTYKDGILDGLSTNWYENGQKKVEVTYKDYRINGLVTIWYENGQKESEGVWLMRKYLDGEYYRDGKWTFWYENGNKKSEGYFILYEYGRENVSELLTGDFKPDNVRGSIWADHGNAKTIHLKKKYHPHVDGKWTWWYDNGNKKREGSFIIIPKEEATDGYGSIGEWGIVTDSKWTWWDENGDVVKETAYKDGQELWTKP